MIMVTKNFNWTICRLVRDSWSNQRSVGAGTDIVDKEMYTFETKGGDSLTLRPEMTASVVRAYLENDTGDQLGYVSSPFQLVILMSLRSRTSTMCRSDE